MGCRHSRDATAAQEPGEAADASTPAMRPSTPSYRADNSANWTTGSGSRANDFRSEDELPSFVVSDSAELVGSSDSEAVHGLVSGFTFSFIQVSDASSNESSGGTGLGSSSSMGSFISSDGSTTSGPPGSQQSGAADAAELLPIPEEHTHSGPRDGDDQHSQRQPERAMTTTPASQSSVMEPEAEALPAEEHVEASGTGNRSRSATRASVTTSELSEAGEYSMTATGDVVRHVSDCGEQSISQVANAVAQQAIDDGVANVASTMEGEERRGRITATTQSSLSVQPPSSRGGQLAEVVPSAPPSGIPAGWTYSIVDTSTENGVVLYNVQLTDEVGDNAKWPNPVKRRYSSFAEMYAKLKESGLPAAELLPELPRAGVLHFVRGRQNKRTVEERRRKFSAVLRYVAQHRELHDNAAFQSFISQ